MYLRALQIQTFRFPEWFLTNDVTSPGGGLMLVRDRGWEGRALSWPTKEEAEAYAAEHGEELLHPITREPAPAAPVQEPTPPPPDPILALGVKAWGEAVDGVDDLARLGALLQAERAGQNRATAIQQAERRMRELLASAEE